MMEYIYLDMRVKYRYMLVLAAFFFIEYALAFLGSLAKFRTYDMFVALVGGGVYTVAMGAGLTLVAVALLGLTRKVKFDESSVVINHTRIRFDEIKSIGFDEKKEIKLCFTVEYGFLRSCAAVMDKRESDEDIGQFRQAMGELVQRTKQSNPNANISAKAAFFAAPGSKVFAEAEESIRREKAKLTGIGGWLLYIALSLAFTGVGGLLSPVATIGMMLLHQSPGGSLWGDMAYAFLSAVYIPLSVLLLVSMFKQRAAFRREYLAFLVYQLAAGMTLLALKYTFIDGSWPGALSVINSFVVGAVEGVVWIFAWREYFRRSIRVRNTFGTDGSGGSSSTGEEKP